MNTRVQVALLLLVIGVGEPGRTEAAQRNGSPNPDRKAAKMDRGDAFVSVVTQPTGEPILVIKYPWKRHARPSVEVRVLEPSEADNPLIRPLLFLHAIMKGDVTTAVYRCQDDSEDTSQTATFSRDGMDYEVFGARNSLGRPSVCVACQTATQRPRTVAEVVEESDSLIEASTTPPEPETRAAFPLLDAWAVDERTLYLELPAKYFSRPSKIRVWLMRHKDIVWTAEADWPGAGGTPNAPAPLNSTPNAPE
ncbi:MAG TPA: hypothetical protein VMY37_07270 [Thermoguttaceae bacterium]|nr:hypothetical protein [Thermoguttaceae bacterium]